MQAPTLVRLPPGVIFSDDGGLSGQIDYDPHRESQYDVDFVAVSTNQWNDESIGLIRLEIHFKVNDNQPPSNFDKLALKNNRTMPVLQHLNYLRVLIRLGILGNNVN